MDHETEVAAPTGPAAPEVDERIAAFKRGAPLPKTTGPKGASPKAPSPATASPKAASPATDAPEAPSRPRPARARPAPEPNADRPDEDRGADVASAGEPPEGGEGTGSSSGARRRRRGGRGRGGGARPADGSTPADRSTGAATEADDEAEPPVTGRVRAAGPADLDDRAETTASTGAETTDSTGGETNEGASTSSGPRKRRRRGGRGRGRGGKTASAARELDESVDTAPERQTAESQRDDAAPDEPTDATGSSPVADRVRRRRHRSPSRP